MNFEQALELVYREGRPRTDRTGTGTRSLVGVQIRYDLQQGFPLLTSKRVHFDSVVAELLWFLRGETNINTLDATIWDEWADQNGDLGRIYGAQWRNFGGVDQIAQVQSSLRNDPFSRRHLVSAWNPPELDNMALPPCHYSFQFYVHVEPKLPSYPPKLSIVVSQRSADMFLGVPFNLASYALLTHLMATTLGYSVGELVWNGGDCHIYDNHVEQVEQQLRQAADAKPLPMLFVPNTRDNVWEYQPDDIRLLGYQPQPRIPAPVAV